MQIDFIQQIYDFNRQAGLLDQPLDDYREASFLIEEALEGFNTSALASAVGAASNSPKDISRAIVSLCKDSADTILPATLSPVSRVDKGCDAITFAAGYLFKCGLTPTQVEQAMSIVMDANLQKLSMPRDSFGKLMKPADFIGPEERLKQLLEE